MLKKIIILFFIFLFITSCSGGDIDKNNSDAKNGLVLFENKYFSIFIPASWEIIKNDDSSIIPKPANGEIVLAVVKKGTIGFLNNLLILSEQLDSNIDSSKYSILNNVGSKSNYYSYNLIEEKDIKFLDGNKSKLYIFNARYSENTPKLLFLQTGVVCPDNKGYLLTIGLERGQNNFSKYEKILETFSCK